MEKKIIFLDIDGHLMDFDGQLPESAQMALYQAKAEGHRLVLCTCLLYTSLLCHICLEHRFGTERKAGTDR